MHLTIGQVAKETNCKVQTIRYYEEIGILNTPLRSDGNHRIYNNDAVARIKFIRHARDLGYSIKSVRELLSLSEEPERSCESIDRIARTQLTDVLRKIKHLKELEKELRRMINECSGGTISECRIIDAMK